MLNICKLKDLSFLTQFGKLKFSEQIRTVQGGWTDWRMLRDYNRRRAVKSGSAERTRINTIRKNDILPREIREMADKEMSEYPRYTMYIGLTERCCLTSRSYCYGVGMRRWRMSRIMFRHLADYNHLAGVQRAFWG